MHRAGSGLGGARRKFCDVLIRDAGAKVSSTVRVPKKRMRIGKPPLRGPGGRRHLPERPKKEKWYERKKKSWHHASLTLPSSGGSSALLRVFLVILNSFQDPRVIGNGKGERGKPSFEGRWRAAPEDRVARRATNYKNRRRRRHLIAMHYALCTLLIIPKEKSL